MTSGEFDYCLKGLWVLKSHEAETAAPAGIVVIHDPDVFDLSEAPEKKGQVRARYQNCTASCVRSDSLTQSIP